MTTYKIVANDGVICNYNEKITTETHDEAVSIVEEKTGLKFKQDFTLIRKTKTSTEVKRRYLNKVYTRIAADLPKDLAAKFKETVKRNSTTTAQVLRTALERYIAENN
jgi:predicted metal-dependent hydrolase